MFAPSGIRRNMHLGRCVRAALRARRKWETVKGREISQDVLVMQRGACRSRSIGCPFGVPYNARTKTRTPGSEVRDSLAERRGRDGSSGSLRSVFGWLRQPAWEPRLATPPPTKDHPSPVGFSSIGSTALLSGAPCSQESRQARLACRRQGGGDSSAETLGLSGIALPARLLPVPQMHVAAKLLVGHAAQLWGRLSGAVERGMGIVVVSSSANCCVDSCVYACAANRSM